MLKKKKHGRLSSGSQEKHPSRTQRNGFISLRLGICTEVSSHLRSSSRGEQAGEWTSVLQEGHGRISEIFESIDSSLRKKETTSGCVGCSRLDNQQASRDDEVDCGSTGRIEVGFAEATRTKTNG